jgi:hypothetical protein
MTSRRSNLFVLLFVVSACGDGSAAPGESKGTLTFTYTGAGGGSFSATGGISDLRNGSQSTAAFVVASKNAADTSTSIVANRPRGRGFYDLADIIIDRQTVGAGTISASCSPTVFVACSEFTVLFNLIMGDRTGATSCTLVAGTITIEAISAGHVRGSFSGTGTCRDDSPSPPSVFAVSNGSFSVPLSPEAIF